MSWSFLDEYKGDTHVTFMNSKVFFFFLLKFFVSFDLFKVPLHCRITSNTLQSLRKFISPLNDLTERLKGGSRDWLLAVRHLNIFASRILQSCLRAQINKGGEAAGLVCFRYIWQLECCWKSWLQFLLLLWSGWRVEGEGALSQLEGSSLFPAEQLWISPVCSCRLRFCGSLFSIAVPVDLFEHCLFMWFLVLRTPQNNSSEYVRTASSHIDIRRPKPPYRRRFHWLSLAILRAAEQIAICSLLTRPPLSHQQESFGRIKSYK